MNLSEGQIFDAVRGEMRSQMRLSMTLPRNVPSPERYWELFRKLNASQMAEIAAVPVADFLAGVADPSDDELADFFDKYKTQPPGPRGQPGLMQPRRVRIEYFEANEEEHPRRSWPPPSPSPTKKSKRITRTTRNRSATSRLPPSRPAAPPTPTGPSLGPKPKFDGKAGDAKTPSSIGPSPRHPICPPLQRKAPLFKLPAPQSGSQPDAKPTDEKQTDEKKSVPCAIPRAGLTVSSSGANWKRTFNWPSINRPMTRPPPPPPTSRRRLHKTRRKRPRRNLSPARKSSPRRRLNQPLFALLLKAEFPLPEFKPLDDDLKRLDR